MIMNPTVSGGIQLPDLSNPGVADDLRSGKQLVGADGGIITGTLAEVQQAVPTISVSSSGLITASATQSGGIVEGGSQSAIQQLTTQAGKTIVPGTTQQTAIAAGNYASGDIFVAGDANLWPENIASGISIFGVQGSFTGVSPIYEFVSPENVLFDNDSAPITITITLNYDIEAIYGINMIFQSTRTGMGIFSYPASAFIYPNEVNVYRILPNKTSLYSLSFSGNSLYITRDEDTNLTGADLSVTFGAAVYYTPKTGG